MSMDHVPRIAPLASPYEAEIATALAKWMPPGSAWEPLKLFRTLYRNPEISSCMRALGVGILGPHSSLDPHEQTNPVWKAWGEASRKHPCQTA